MWYVFGALVAHLADDVACNYMADKRIMLTVTRKFYDFLERMAEETGVDRSNLIRGWIWEKMQQERDRMIAERQLADAVSKRPK